MSTHRVFRWRRVFAFISVFLSTLLAAIYLIISTEAGTRWLIQQAEYYTPIKFDTSNGNLVTGLRVNGIELATETLSVHVENAVINLDFWQLLFNQQLKLAELSASRINVNSADSDTPSDTHLPSLPALPVAIDIRQLDFAVIKINDHPNLSLAAANISLKQQNLAWTSLNIATDQANIKSNGQWQSSSLQATLNTKVVWQQADMSGELALKGPLKQLALTHQFKQNDITIATQGVMAIKALDDIHIDVDNQLSPLSIDDLSIENAIFNVKSDTNNILLEVNAGLTHPHSGAVTLTSKGSGTLADGFSINSQLQALRGTIDIASIVELQPNLTLSNTFKGQHLQLNDSLIWPLDAPLATGIAGKFNLAITDTLAWSLEQFVLSGKLAESPIRLELAAHNEQDRIEISKLEGYHLNDRLKARAIIVDKLVTGSGLLDIDNLQRYRSDLQGDSHVAFQLSTTLDNWQQDNHIKLQASSTSLQMGSLTLGGIKLDVQNDGHDLQASLQSDYLHQGPLALQDIKQTFIGTLSEQTVNLNGQGSSVLIFEGKAIALPPLMLDAQWFAKGDQQARLTLNAQDDNVIIESQFNVARDQQLSGHLSLHSPQLSWLKQFSPRIDAMQGQFNATSRISGTTLNPELSTQLELQIAKLELIDPNISLQAMSLAGELNPKGEVTFKGHAEQGGKPINIVGNGWLVGEKALSLNAHIDAKQLSAHTPKVDIAISPDIDLHVSQHTLSVNGSLTVPNANIELSQLPNPSYSTSPDVIVVGREPSPQQQGLKHDVDLSIIIEDNTVIKAAGLATKLKGNVHFKSQSQRPDYVQGKLIMVDGRLNSSGQDLYIKKGELIFTGSPDNPGLDIIAMRKITNPDIEVGLHITGTLKNMKTEVTSAPTIDASRTLSFLAFGKDITQESEDADSNAQLMSAAVSLGIGQSSQLIQSLRRSTGLDELAAVANDSGSASLIAGKQLSSKLFARYRYDMADAIGVLLLRYTINQQWSIEAESGNDTSVDVLYRLGD